MYYFTVIIIHVASNEVTSSKSELLTKSMNAPKIAQLVLPKIGEAQLNHSIPRQSITNPAPKNRRSSEAHVLDLISRSSHTSVHESKVYQRYAMLPTDDPRRQSLSTASLSTMALRRHSLMPEMRRGSRDGEGHVSSLQQSLMKFVKRQATMLGLQFNANTLKEGLEYVNDKKKHQDLISDSQEWKDIISYLELSPVGRQLAQAYLHHQHSQQQDFGFRQVHMVRAVPSSSEMQQAVGIPVLSVTAMGDSLTLPVINDDISEQHPKNRRAKVNTDNIRPRKTKYSESAATATANKRLSMPSQHAQTIHIPS